MKCKICPVCGKVNKVSAILCEGCSEDLMQVIPSLAPEGFVNPDPATPDSGVNREEDSTAQNCQVPNGPEPDDAGNKAGRTASGMRFGRKCPVCGKISPYREAKCSCGTLLLTAPPVKLEEKKPAVIAILQSEDGKCRVSLTQNDERILGRKADGGEYLCEKPFVSANHLKVTVKDGEVYITHIGRTNPTLVNGRMIEPEKPFHLSEGDVIALGAREGQSMQSEAAYFSFMKPKPDNGNMS